MKDLIIILYKEQLLKLDTKLIKNSQVVMLDDIIIDETLELIDKSPCVLNSYMIYKWLNNKDNLPENIYFLDEGALGYFTIQAKNVLGAFEGINIHLINIGKTNDKYRLANEWSIGKAYDLKLSYMENYSVYSSGKQHKQRDLPLVSVCISHFNHGRYLPDTLEALNNNTYSNFEVIIIDSESTDPYSIKVFNNMENRYKDRFKFYHRKNESLGETRNHAVEMASGEYIIFFDTDNIPEKNMIEMYVKCMKRSGADCLTAHNIQFEEGMKDILFTPIGPALAYGIFENCFGDSAFCVKKSVFKELGGFTQERLGLEDWEFLAKMSIREYKQDVVPVPLYRYRRDSLSMANTVNNYKSHNRVLRAYMENQPEYIKQLLIEFCVPLYKNGYKQYEEIDETCNPIEGIYMGGILIKFIKVIQKIIPAKSNIYNSIKRMIKR